MCTGVRFADEDGNMYLGRNLDWSFSYGEKIVVTPRGYKTPVAFNATVADPKPVMGVGIIVEGMPMYFDCANDEGLAVAGLNFPGYAQYADAPVDGTVNVAAYELPFWIARSFSTVDQVEEALKNVTVVGKQVNEQYPVSLLHWIVGDGKRSIVIEAMADGIHVHHDGVDVLANQPTFDWHTENLRNYLSMDPRIPEPVKWGHPGAQRVGLRLRHARHSGRLQLAVAFRARRLHERPLPGAEDRGVERLPPVPHAGFGGDGGWLRAHEQRPVREDDLHERLLRQDQHLLQEHVRGSGHQELPHGRLRP